MRRHRKRTRVIGGLLAGLLLLSLGSSGATAKDLSEWHRLNPNGSQQTSEHERLTCREGSTSWTCVYDKLPDPGYMWTGTTGRFAGRDVTSSWTCPEWFPIEACTGVVQVLRGTAVFLPDGGRPFTVGQEYIVTRVGGQSVLYVHWIDMFVCPWYRTFDEALSVNPTFQFDCTLA
jgi:hypothetical protein